jgi:hypothetical protein
MKPEIKMKKIGKERRGWLSQGDVQTAYAKVR